MRVGARPALVRPNKYSAKVTPLPRTIERVVLKPAVAPPPHVGCHCSDDTVGYRSLVEHARLLRDKDHRVLLLNADPTDPPDGISIVSITCMQSRSALPVLKTLTCFNFSANASTCRVILLQRTVIFITTVIH